MVSLNAFAVAKRGTRARRTHCRRSMPSFMTQEKHLLSVGLLRLLFCHLAEGRERRGHHGSAGKSERYSALGIRGQIDVSCRKTGMNMGVRLQCPCVTKPVLKYRVRAVSLVIRKHAGAGRCCLGLSDSGASRPSITR